MVADLWHDSISRCRGEKGANPPDEKARNVFCWPSTFRCARAQTLYISQILIASNNGKWNVHAKLAFFRHDNRGGNTTQIGHHSYQFEY